MQIEVEIENAYSFACELWRGSQTSPAFIHSANATQDLGELIDETFTNGLLADRIPVDVEELHCRITPSFRVEPVVDNINIEITPATNGGPARSFTQQFASGRWVRSAQWTTLRLQQQGTISAKETLYRMLVARRDANHSAVPPPALQTPMIVDGSLEQMGIRRLGDGPFVPTRPVLINERVVVDAIDSCEAAGRTETGGAVLGKIIRLSEPLDGTETSLVTILSATVLDNRHVGAASRFDFSPEGLADADHIAELRGFGESVLTVYHTHGFCKECGRCNQDPNCPLAEVYPSLEDYRLLESLFSSKATLMPIAGRRLGTEGNRPILEILAWRGGEMQPIPWKTYRD